MLHILQGLLALAPISTEMEDKFRETISKHMS
jgi:hypothetical protein